MNTMNTMNRTLQRPRSSFVAAGTRRVLRVRGGGCQIAHARGTTTALRAWEREQQALMEREELDEVEVDPITGMPVGKTSVVAKVAGQKVNAGGLSLSYRRTEPDPSTASSSNKLPVLLLHGLGSSSYCYRTTLALLGGEGFDAIAVDLPGHGDSDKPEGSGFDYSEAAYVKSIGDFIAAVGIKQPFALVVHGFILGQYALLYAQQHPDQIDRLMILNTPVALNSKLRPELAAYKAPLPFMRPGSKPFDGATYAAMGSPYAMAYGDAETFNKPYAESPAASAAISKTMDKVDFPQLLKKVNEGFMSWKKPTALCFGSSDPFLDINSVFDFLENKRTNMRVMSIGAKMGHMPQEDYAEVLHANVMMFLTQTPEDWAKAQAKSYKMSKKGVVL